MAYACAALLVGDTGLHMLAAGSAAAVIAFTATNTLVHTHAHMRAHTHTSESRVKGPPEVQLRWLPGGAMAAPDVQLCGVWKRMLWFDALSARSTASPQAPISSARCTGKGRPAL